ncbi:MAG: SDR family NAD(P)-dependent oxidoreductase [Chitinophagaceae bacterium]|nr:MAG: SDR family NAD(P)-dependent oxidoreductase [Chitinophagaceae bacterium]
MQQTVLIVGGTSGLGRRLAEMYAAEGAKVGIVGRRQHLLDEIKSQFPVETFAFDICRNDAFEGMQAIIKKMGGVDILILAASVVEFNPLLHYAIEEKTAAVNVLGFVAVVNAAYQHFTAKGKGQLVTITSIAAARGNKTAPAYNASKSFQASYTEGIRLKLLQEEAKIAVTEIVPGYMDTQMAKGDRLFWMASLEKASRQSKRAIDLKRRRVYVSRRWWLVYKVYEFLPSFLYTALINSRIKFEKRD